MSLFCYITHSFLYKRNDVSYILQLIWGDAIFVKVVAISISLSFVARIVLTKLKTTHSFPYTFFFTHSFSYRRNDVSYILQLIRGDAIFVKVVAINISLSFVARIVLTKLKTTA